MANGKRAKAANSSWDAVASWYDALQGEQGSEYHQRIIFPGVARMLSYGRNDVALQRILDLACGSGVLCRYLAERGAALTGIDLSEELLQRAKSYPEQGKSVCYLKADATRLLDEDGKPLYGLDAVTYDAVCLVLAVQNMTSLSSIWRGVATLLAPKGILVLVLMHPCFRIPQRSDWRWNEAFGRQERVLWQYLQSEELAISIHPGRAAEGATSETVVHYHRPLQAYVNTLGNAGLLIDHLEEWSSHKREEPGKKQQALDLARREFPLFMALRAKKAE